MTHLVAVKGKAPLSIAEREEFQFHSLQIQEAIAKGQDARRELVNHVLHILENNLWRDNYESAEDYIKTELNLEVSSFWREAKNNKNYLYLVANAEDRDEQITLTRMRGAAYRELRQLATDGKPVLKKGGESEEEYRKRLEEKEEIDSQSVLELWKVVYPKIAEHRKVSGNGVYPTGGYSVTASDIAEACMVIQQLIDAPRLLRAGVPPEAVPLVTLEGRDITYQDMEDVSESTGGYKPEIIDAMTQLGVTEALTQKLRRQNSHILDKLEKKYHYDRFAGTLMYVDGRLIIKNQYGIYDLLKEWSDMLEKETEVSIRRVARTI